MLLHSDSIFCVDMPPERDGMANRDPGYKRTSALDRNCVPIRQDNGRFDNGNRLYSGVESTASQVVERVYKSAKKIIQEPIYSHIDLPTSEDDGASSDVKKERDRVYSVADTLGVQERDRIYSGADTIDHIYSGIRQSISEDSGHVYISGNSAHNEHTYACGK